MIIISRGCCDGILFIYIMQRAARHLDAGRAVFDCDTRESFIKCIYLAIKWSADDIFTSDKLILVRVRDGATGENVFKYIKTVHFYATLNNFFFLFSSVLPKLLEDVWSLWKKIQWKIPLPFFRWFDELFFWISMEFPYKKFYDFSYRPLNLFPKNLKKDLFSNFLLRSISVKLFRIAEDCCIMPV